MRRSLRRLVIAGIALLVLVGVAYGGFFLLLVGSDHATYYADGQYLGPVDYDATLAAADGAGYGVTEPRYVNARTPRGYAPTDAPAITEAYGEDVRVWRVHFTHPDGARAELTFETGGDGVGLVVTNPAVGATESYTAQDLPPRDWLAERVAAATALSEASAEQAVRRFAREVEETGPDLPSTTVEASPDPAGLRAYLQSSSDEMQFDPPRGEGTFAERYLTGTETVATVTYLVPNAEIRQRVDGPTYRVYVDQLGGVRLEVTLRPGERVPLETRERVFRELFEVLGLPVEAVETYRWSYSSGNW